ncbi:MAG: type II/IV secretion system ATPase subunit [Thermofilum sp.]
MFKTRSFFTLLKTLPITPLLRQRSQGFGKDSLMVVKNIVEEYQSGYVVENPVEGLILEEYELPFNVKTRIVRNSNVLQYAIEEPPIPADGLEEVCRLILELESRRVAEYGEGLSAGVLYSYSKIASGYGPLYPFTLDERVEEISLDKRTRRVHVIHRAYSWYGWLPTNVSVRDDLIDKLVLSLARRSGKHISLQTPIAEGLTREGLRVSLTFGGEVSRAGSSIVVRRRPGSPLTITRLLSERVLSSTVASYLWLILENKGWIIVAGGVGAGKTTLLQALLTLIPPSRRVVSIEDTPELNGSTGLWDPLVERTPADRNGGSITSYDLLRFALRRRPDYIVVGEVRGVEARLLVQASRLGHGVLTTIHADNPRSVLERLAAPPISIPRALLKNISAIVHVVNQQGVRRVSSVSEVDWNSQVSELCASWEDCFKLSPRDIASASRMLRGVVDGSELIAELEKRADFLEENTRRGVFNHSILSEKLLDFYFGKYSWGLTGGSA